MKACNMTKDEFSQLITVLVFFNCESLVFFNLYRSNSVILLSLGLFHKWKNLTIS